jgi:hypothetical protein
MKLRYAPPFILAAALALTGCSGGGTTYQASVAGWSVVNPADLAVTVKVTNTGTTAGIPSCTIQAHDAAYAYTGIDVVSLQQPVPAGAFRLFTDDITITGQGAQYVTQATVKCT